MLYGATVFTTLRIYENDLNHPLTNWKAHCDRLKFSLESFDWSPPDWLSLRQGAELIINSYPVMRIAIFPDGREWITGRSLPADLQQRQQQGINAYIAPSNLSRSLPNHKTGNYLTPWLAKITAQKLDAQEAILVDTQGNWLETSTGNLWGWNEDGWWTPPTEVGILPGVIRNRLIEYLKHNHNQVYELPWNQETIQKFHAIAYSNSVVEVIPIRQVIAGNQKLQYNPLHPNFDQLRGLFES